MFYKVTGFPIFGPKPSQTMGNLADGDVAFDVIQDKRFSFLHAFF